MSTASSNPVQVTGRAQAAAWQANRVARPEEVRPGLWAVALPIPEGHLPSSFGYALIGDDGVHVIDPGWASDESVDHWRDFLNSQGRGLGDIATVLVTHSHPDHLGLADRLREASGAKVVMTAVETEVLNTMVADALDADGWMPEELRRWGVPEGLRDELIGELDAAHFSTPILPDATVSDGEELRLAGRTLLAHVTPGHTEGHLCLEDVAAELVFTGDHVLPHIFPGVGLGQLPGSEPLGDYLRSLARIGELDHCEVLPGHEYRFRGLRVRCEQIAAHHLKRTAAVLEVYRRVGDAGVWEVTRQLPWTRGFANLRGFALQSALRQTELHLAAVQCGDAEVWLSRGLFNHAG